MTGLMMLCVPTVENLLTWCTMTSGVSELYQTALLGGVARVCNSYPYLFISAVVTCMTLTVD